MKRIGITFLGLIVALSVLMVGCSEDTENPENPPQLPPKASLSTNLGTFPQNEDGRVDETNTKSNFLFAAVNVGFWQTTIVAAIGLPAAAFEAAFDHDFEYLKDQGRWQSTYTVNVNSKEVTADLYAKKNDETISWEMYLSVEGQYEDILWFTGESRLDNTGGDWVLYGNPSDPREVLSIDWDREGDDFINSRYVLIDDTSSKMGSFIEYGLSAEADFSHYYEVSIIDSEGDDYDALIWYNKTTTEGRVRSSSHFGDSNWRCWNTSLEDTDC